MIRIPSKLKAGDKIGIVSTARRITQEELAPCLADLEKWGLKPVPGDNLFAEDHQFAGTDAQRAADLQAMLDDSSIRGILCARGGYGTLRILEMLDLRALRKDPKWIVGFSDVTALSVACLNHKVATIHGPMAISWNGVTGDAASRQYLRQILMEDNPSYSFTPTREDLTRTGVASGRLIGGNLSMLSQLLGTPTDFDTEGCILFLEDLDEYLYHVDRMTVHLKRGGKFAKLAGLIVGGMTDMNDNSTPFGKTAEEIIADAVKDFDFPVCYGFPVGHWPQNYPLIHGGKATLRVSHSRAELEFEEG